VLVALAIVAIAFRVGARQGSWRAHEILRDGSYARCGS
jgi:hypothetical protein